MSKRTEQLVNNMWESYDNSGKRLAAYRITSNVEFWTKKEVKSSAADVVIYIVEKGEKVVKTKRKQIVIIDNSQDIGSLVTDIKDIMNVKIRKGKNVAIYSHNQHIGIYAVFFYLLYRYYVTVSNSMSYEDYHRKIERKFVVDKLYAKSNIKWAVTDDADDRGYNTTKHLAFLVLEEEQVRRIIDEQYRKNIIATGTSMEELQNLFRDMASR